MLRPGVALSLLLCSVLWSPGASAREDRTGEFIVQVRALAILPDIEESSTTIGGSVDVEERLTPELDLTYFFTNEIAAELVLTTTEHDVTASDTALGSLDLGSLWLLPPTLLLQYHFDTDGAFDPSVGAGINRSIFYNEDSGQFRDVEYDDTIGFALQAGFDVRLNDTWSIGFDVKKYFLNVDASVNGGAVTADVDLDPFLIGIGIGYHF